MFSTDSVGTNHRIVVVTGASKGIGRHIALELGKQKFNLILHYSSDLKGVQSVCHELEQINIKTAIVQGDFSNSSHITKMVKEIRASAQEMGGTGKIYALINNAGISLQNQTANASQDYIEKIFSVNTLAPIGLTAGLIDYISDGGRIINITSICSRSYIPGLSIYGATKGAMESFTKNLAMELAPRKILVNAISPGVTATETSSWLQDKQVREIVAAGHPLKDIGNSHDIAAAVTYLLQESGRWISGQTITISGGQ